ncbi:MAG: hypothetical protein ACYDHN_15885 [Solirubrobacteraceae bacterium]
MSASSPADGREVHDRRLKLELEGFAWKTLDEEAEREGLTVEELVTFSVLYYLADIDSGRISRRISGSPYPRPLDPPLDIGPA